MNSSEIEERWPFLSLMHPAHLDYIKKFPLNTLKYFIGTLTGLDPEKRYEILSTVTWLLYVPYMTPEEVRAICEDKENLFFKFVVKCGQTIETCNEALFVMAIVQFLLYQLAGRGDKTDIDQAKDRIIGLVESLQKIPVKPDEQESADRFVDTLVTSTSATDMPETT